MRKIVIMKCAENAIYKVAAYRAAQYFPETGVNSLMKPLIIV
jgi:hypothetical protein